MFPLQFCATQAKVGREAVRKVTPGLLPPQQSALAGKINRHSCGLVLNSTVFWDSPLHLPPAGAYLFFHTPCTEIQTKARTARTWQPFPSRPPGGSERCLGRFVTQAPSLDPKAHFRTRNRRRCADPGPADLRPTLMSAASLPPYPPARGGDRGGSRWPKLSRISSILIRRR